MALAVAFRVFLLLLLFLPFSIAVGVSVIAPQQFSEPSIRELAVTSASIADYALHSDDSNVRFVLNEFEGVSGNRLFKSQYDEKTLERVFSEGKTHLSGDAKELLEKYLKEEAKKSQETARTATLIESISGVRVTPPEERVKQELNDVVARLSKQYPGASFGAGSPASPLIGGQTSGGGFSFMVSGVIPLDNPKKTYFTVSGKVSSKNPPQIISALNSVPTFTKPTGSSLTVGLTYQDKEVQTTMGVITPIAEVQLGLGNNFKQLNNFVTNVYIENKKSALTAKVGFDVKKFFEGQFYPTGVNINYGTNTKGGFSVSRQAGDFTLEYAKGDKKVRAVFGSSPLEILSFQRLEGVWNPKGQLQVTPLSGTSGKTGFNVNKFSFTIAKDEKNQVSVSEAVLDATYSKSEKEKVNVNVDFRKGTAGKYEIPAIKLDYVPSEMAGMPGTVSKEQNLDINVNKMTVAFGKKETGYGLCALNVGVILKRGEKVVFQEDLSASDYLGAKVRCPESSILPPSMQSPAQPPTQPPVGESGTQTGLPSAPSGGLQKLSRETIASLAGFYTEKIMSDVEFSQEYYTPAARAQVSSKVKSYLVSRFIELLFPLEDSAQEVGAFVEESLDNRELIPTQVELTGQKYTGFGEHYLTVGDSIDLSGKSALTYRLIDASGSMVRLELLTGRELESGAPGSSILLRSKESKRFLEPFPHEIVLKSVNCDTKIGRCVAELGAYPLEDEAAVQEILNSFGLPSLPTAQMPSVGE